MGRSVAQRHSLTLFNDISSVKPIRSISLVLAAFLQWAPLLQRSAPALPALTRSPAAILFQWFAGALAVAGSYHTVSAATATVQSPKSISGTVGTRLSHQIRINDGKNRQPGSWAIAGKNYTKSGSTTVGLPPGLSLALSTAIISGIPSTSGTFPVQITAYEDPNQRGAKLSFTLTFTIAGGSAPPTITGPPVGGTILEGGSLTLTVEAASTTPLQFQWYHDGQAIPGAISSSLAIAAAVLSDAGTYWATVSNDAGTATSDSASIVVNPVVVATHVDQSPESAAFHPGESPTLQVRASGSSPLAYQWSKDGTPIPDATSPGLVLTPVSLASAGVYSVKVSGPGGIVVSDPATLTVVPMQISRPILSSASATLEAATIIGRSYELLASETLAPESWTVVAEFTATIPVTTVSPAAPPGSSWFWRYRTAP